MAVKEIIQNLYLSWNRRKTGRENVQINFFDRLASVRSIIVYLPEEKKYFDAVVGEMDRLKKIYPIASITLLYHRNNMIPTAFSGRFTLVEWSSEDANGYGAPRVELKRKLFRSPCDMIIDLNPEYHFFFACLSQASGAPIRIGFAHPQGDDFYNLVFRPKSLQDLAKATSSLLKYLSLASKVPIAE